MIATNDSTLFAGLLVDPGESEMLVEGKQARRIATDLYLSEMTVRYHIRAILRELDCHSQLGAVAEARRLGLV